MNLSSFINSVSVDKGVWRLQVTLVKQHTSSFWRVSHCPDMWSVVVGGSFKRTVNHQTASCQTSIWEGHCIHPLYTLQYQTLCNVKNALDFCGSSASSWPLSVNVCTLLPFVSETHLPSMSAVNTQDGPLNCKTNQDIVMFHSSMQNAI